MRKKDFQAHGTAGRGSAAWLAIGLWISLAGALGYLWLTHTSGPTTQGPHSAANVQARRSPVAESALTAMVAEKTAELGLKPKSETTPADQALEVSSAIKAGDFARAKAISEVVLARSRVEGWGFYPLNDFMNAFTRGDDAKLLAGLNLWLHQDPNNGLAYLMRARYYRHAAWDARGAEVSSMVPGNLMQRFRDDLSHSASDASEAIRLNPRVPSSYYELLEAQMIDGNSDAVDQAFEAGIKVFPNYYPLYKSRLRVLTPKWGGSAVAMYGFVDRYAGNAAKDSPLRLLYLDRRRSGVCCNHETHPQTRTGACSQREGPG